MVATATAENSWQPGEIPSTIGASLQSWLRPNHQPRTHHHHHHHHHHKGRDATNGNSSTSASASASSSTSASASSSSLSPTQQQQDREASAAVASAEAGVGNDPAAAQATLPAPGVALTYPGKWDQLSAQAELYLYAAASPYFRGAHLGNVQNPLHSSDVGAFSGMWEQASGRSPTGKESQAEGAAHSSSRRFPAEQRATIGTTLHTDGKVGSIRWVAADPEFKEVKQSDAHGAHGNGSGWMRWLTGSSSTMPAKCLNVLEIGRPEVTKEEEEREEKIVVLAGYGAGIAFFYRNFAALAARPNSRLYALDWLGMGRSSRPNFHIPSSALHSDKTRVEAAEGWFIESLEEWRKKAGIEKMTLVGHSLGGYLSVGYTLRYPSRVSRLVLVSPAGVGEAPEEHGETQGQGQGQDKNESTFAPKNATYVPEASRGNIDADAASVNSQDVEREVLESQEHAGVPANKAQAEQDAHKVDQQAAGASSNQQQPTASSGAASSSSAGPKPAPPPPRFSPRTRAVFSWLWEQNYSPFGLLRTSSFLGPWLASRYTSRRFSALPDGEKKAIAAYTQAIFLSRGSGEYCLAHLLLPGAWARLPIANRAKELKRELPVSFIYGESDWMDVEAGRDVVRRLREWGNVGGGRTFVVPHAGHNVHIDNPRALDRLLGRILDAKADTSRAKAVA